MARLSLKRSKKEKPLTFSDVTENMVTNSKVLSVTTDTLTNKIPQTLENLILNPTKLLGLKLSSVMDYVFCMVVPSLLTYYYFNCNK
tara:strand:+ start:134 stop:394 length:261 start_codon:yes stop_codon:yes gene_type:complete